jgi:hypothetical protein
LDLLELVAMAMADDRAEPPRADADAIALCMFHVIISLRIQTKQAEKDEGSAELTMQQRLCHHLQQPVLNDCMGWKHRIPSDMLQSV